MGESLSLKDFKSKSNKGLQIKNNYMKKSISMNEALQIARSDASKVYRELSNYEIKINMVDDKWIIDYLLKDDQSQGGGPHYIISAENGEILHKEYHQ